MKAEIGQYKINITTLPYFGSRRKYSYDKLTKYIIRCNIKRENLAVLTINILLIIITIQLFEITLTISKIYGQFAKISKHC